MNLDAALQEYMKTPAVQTSFQKYCKSVGGSVGARATQAARQYADEAKETILRYLPYSLSRKINTMVDCNEYVDDQGRHVITFGFKPDQLHRESLYPEEYPDGIDDIVALFTTGYFAKQYAYGWWDNHKGYHLRDSDNDTWIRSKISRSPDPFIVNAMQEFNTKHKNDGVRLYFTDIGVDKYIPRNRMSMFAR